MGSEVLQKQELRELLVAEIEAHELYDNCHVLVEYLKFLVTSEVAGRQALGAIVYFNLDALLTEEPLITFGCYEAGVGPDGSLWCTASGTQIVRLELGSDPPASCKAEVYDVPEGGRDARGNGIDSEGVVWVNDRFTDRVISFDRRQCTVLNGPTATGSHCPEGWAVYRKAGPTFRGSSLNSDLNYLITVDTDDTVGLGRDVPITYAVNSGALIALLPDSGEWVMLRVPYPLGFYTRNAHGRIDDPNAGWKGRGLWSANMSYAIWHIEGEPGTMGGKGQKAKTVKFQFRPDPLAK